MAIEHYQFGQVVVDGKRYTSDVTISPQGVGGWWRQEGHQVAVSDLEGVLAQRPEVLVVGTGKYGLVEVMPETRRYLQAQGIELISEDTEQACQTYNRLCPSRRVAAALHLSC